MSTYRAMQVTGPGVFELVERPVPASEPGKVLVHVEACGICHTDAFTVEDPHRSPAHPRVPGHEVIGRILELGAGVKGWSVGQRVGVGFLGGTCGHCDRCRRGDLITCRNKQLSGIHHDGGYAEMMVTDASGLTAVSDDLTPAEAAPLLCAGVTTFNALRNSPARPGDLVAIQGLGGLGHLGVQFARRMGFRVAALARGPEKEKFARDLGAHQYIDVKESDPAKALQALGGAVMILATASDARSMNALVEGLAPRGRLVIVGAPPDPIEVKPGQLISASSSIEGSFVGSALDAEETIAFSVLQGIRPMIETMPLTEVPAAYARMMRNEARFRMVVLPG